MDITTMTILELKALAYDLLANLEQTQRDLQSVQSVIQKKVKEQDVKEDKVED